MRLHDADFELLKVSQLQRYQDAWSWTAEVEDVGMAQTITVETWRTTNGLVLGTIQLWLSTQFWPIAMCKFEVMLRMNNGQLKGTQRWIKPQLKENGDGLKVKTHDTCFLGWTYI
jgi:hypothetical protein